jgi:putative Holliday junction resolvase
MPKIIAIDYGLKRCGIAITDELRMIGSPLETVDTPMIIDYLDKLFAKEKVDTIVIGEALRLDGSPGDISDAQQQFATKLGKKYPSKKIERIDESFTSKLAAQALVAGGMRKSQRKIKSNLDKVSAAIILQYYLEKLAK